MKLENRRKRKKKKTQDKNQYKRKENIEGINNPCVGFKVRKEDERKGKQRKVEEIIDDRGKSRKCNFFLMC